MTIRTTRHSDSIIEIEIETASPTPWLIQPGDKIPFFWNHTLGLSERPRYAIKRRKVPDNPWAIEVLDGATVSPAQDCPDDVADFVGADHRDDVGGLLAVLPIGEYFLIRTAPTPAPRPGVMLGNEWVVDPPEHLATLSMGDEFYALAVGPGTPPDLGRPLLGVAALNYTGNWPPLAALFFDVLAAPSPDISLSDPLVVLPKGGPLVFDGDADAIGHDSDADAKRWRDGAALDYARALAGES